MNMSTKLLWSVIIIIIITIGGWYYYSNNQTVDLSNSAQESGGVAILDSQDDAFEEKEYKEFIPKEDIDTSDWKIYRNDKYGFEFKYPKDWVFKEFKKGEPKQDPSIIDLLVEFYDSTGKIAFFIGVDDNTNPISNLNSRNYEILTINEIHAIKIENQTRIHIVITSHIPKITLNGIKPIKNDLMNVILSSFLIF